MKAQLSCHRCGHSWHIEDEPCVLASLACPSCHHAALPAAAEDFASALEDALVQLYHLGQTHSIDVQLSTARIPASFRPDKDETA